MTQDGVEPVAYADLQQDIADVIAATRIAAARSVNAIMTASYWAVGRRIVEFEQGGVERASYGEALIRRLGADLSVRLGRGFGGRNLAQMRAFYLAWSADRIVRTLSALSAGNRFPVSPRRTDSTSAPSHGHFRYRGPRTFVCPP
ncbi:hypothetical protein OKW46_002161 [Paraburkholderia sp. WSM4179]|nr:hypothetical protein [Paraburkholderia sp. WSM4179]